MMGNLSRLRKDTVEVKDGQTLVHLKKGRTYSVRSPKEENEMKQTGTKIAKTAESSKNGNQK